MKYTHFNEKQNTLYILSNQLLPNTRGMGWKDHSEAYSKAFEMSYPERIEKYATDEAKREIEQELQSHKGCKISEFCYA